MSKMMLALVAAAAAGLGVATVPALAQDVSVRIGAPAVVTPAPRVVVKERCDTRTVRKVDARGRVTVTKVRDC